MYKQPANLLWLQNNNNNTPGRQPNQLRPGPGGRPNGQPGQGGPSGLNRWLLVIVLVMLGIYAYSFFTQNSNNNTNQVDPLSYSAYYDHINAGNIKTAVFNGQPDITGEFKQPVGSYTQYRVIQLPNGDPQLPQLLQSKGVTVSSQPSQDNSFWLNLLFAFVPLILVIALFIFLSRRAGQGQQGIFNFGKSRAKLILEDRPSTTFADVAGVDEAKYDLEEVVEFLKTPQKFQRLGGKIPRGVLLVGPPGTGKTLLARAVAGEAAVPFFSMSGSEFVEVLVGVGASRVRDLFNEAALLAARRNLDSVNQQCFSEALDKILLGAERPLVLSNEDLNVIAYHEGGHALTGLLSEFADPVTKVTIVPRGQALGVTMSTPIDDRYNYSKEYLQTQLVTALGGRSAEEIAIGHITTGAENDLQRVTALARQMVTRWGMSERLGTVSFSERQNPFMGGGDTGAPTTYSEETAEVIDEEVERIVRSGYEHAIEILTTY